MKETKKIKCWNCDGHGIVGHWSHGVLEPDECSTCNGSGSVVQYVGSGRLAKYPGGPLLGSDKRIEA